METRSVNGSDAMMTASKPTVGWIGVGAMGRPMCKNLLRAGYRLTAYDRDHARLDALVSEGASSAASPKDVATASDVVFSTIFDDDGLNDVVLGKNGIAASTGKVSTFIDMSTVSPEASAAVARGLEERGIAYLRAPVSGTVTLAASGKLSTFVSGPKDEFDRQQPLLRALTAQQRYVGKGEEARVIKLLINLMVFMNTAVLGEALAFGARGGLDRRVMLDAIDDSIVGCAHYRGKADKIAARDYQPVGPISLVVKDMDLALTVARANTAALPIAALVRQFLAVMQGRGLSGLDVSAMADLDELVFQK